MSLINLQAYLLEVHSVTLSLEQLEQGWNFQSDVELPKDAGLQKDLQEMFENMEEASTAVRDMFLREFSKLDALLLKGYLRLPNPNTYSLEDLEKLCRMMGFLRMDSSLELPVAQAYVNKTASIDVSEINFDVLGDLCSLPGIVCEKPGRTVEYRNFIAERVKRYKKYERYKDNVQWKEAKEVTHLNQREVSWSDLETRKSSLVSLKATMIGPYQEIRLFDEGFEKLEEIRCSYQQIQFHPTILSRLRVLDISEDSPPIHASSIPLLEEFKGGRIIWDAPLIHLKKIRIETLSVPQEFVPNLNEVHVWRHDGIYPSVKKSNQIAGFPNIEVCTHQVNLGNQIKPLLKLREAYQIFGFNPRLVPNLQLIKHSSTCTSFIKPPGMSNMVWQMFTQPEVVLDNKRCGLKTSQPDIRLVHKCSDVNISLFPSVEMISYSRVIVNERNETTCTFINCEFEIGSKEVVKLLPRARFICDKI